LLDEWLHVFILERQLSRELVSADVLMSS